MLSPVHIDNHRAGAGALQKNLDSQAKGRSLLIPLADLPAGNLQRGMAEHVPRLESCQRGGALPDQHGLERP